MDNYFFRDYFPYRIEIDANKGTVEFLNRYYKSRGRYRCGVPIKDVDFGILKKLASKNAGALREQENGIIVIHLYDDYTLPLAESGAGSLDSELWKIYEEKIKILTEFMKGYNLVEVTK